MHPALVTPESVSIIGFFCSLLFFSRDSVGASHGRLRPLRNSVKAIDSRSQDRERGLLCAETIDEGFKVARTVHCTVRGVTNGVWATLESMDMRKKSEANAPRSTSLVRS